MHLPWLALLHQMRTRDCSSPFCSVDSDGLRLSANYGGCRVATLLGLLMRRRPVKSTCKYACRDCTSVRMTRNMQHGAA